ncbi:MAG TPA: AraC family transcriptional regulator [Caulobacteraceae bacterium]
MTNGDALLAADMALRGGVVLLLLTLAAVVTRDRGRAPSARLGSLFAIGAAAYAVCSAAGFHDQAAWWTAPILALAAGNNVVFWMFARALFDDAFQPRWRHLAIWAAVVALASVRMLVLRPEGSPLTAPVGVILTLLSIGFAGAAIVQTLATWRDDLVERRRAIRVFVVAASAVYTILTNGAELVGLDRLAPRTASLAGAAGLAAIALAVAWSVLRASPGLFDGRGSEPTNRADAPLTPADDAYLAALDRAVTYDRIYRQEGLSIGALAAGLGLPEYRLRRLINQGLGHRNFSSFLNEHRIGEAKAALGDPAQDPVPILTIALDAGFASLGPFNRAFKAETGMTPTEYRRLRTEQAPVLEDRLQVSASRN